MNTLMRGLLAEAANHDTEMPDFSAWSRGAIAAFPVRSYHALRSFKVERFDYPSGRGHDFRLRPVRPAFAETISLARHAWHGVGGSSDPDQGLCRAAIASVGFVRAQLSSVVWIGARLPIYQAHSPASARRFLYSVLAIDWHDGEAVLNANFQPFSTLGADDSSADSLSSENIVFDQTDAAFAEIQGRFTGVSIQSPSTEEIMSGIALLALDAALACQDREHSIGLVSFAANAMWQAGYHAGWETREMAWSDDAKRAGSKGGESRHKASRALKEWALREAPNMGGSDIEIARRLAVRIPSEHRNASADPERLIYEAIRGWRKTTRQGG